jgi:hypothetical protein
MNDDAPRPLARYDFHSGAEGGSQLMLYGAYLVHRSESHLETMPLARVSAISVSFARDRGRLVWAMVLIVVALGLLALTAPLGNLAQGVGAPYRFLELAATVLPVAALACALAGAALGAFGWRGSTSFTLTLAGGERTYVSRGRDTQLLDFAEMTSERLMAGAGK